jgi:hypothetical protein
LSHLTEACGPAERLSYRVTWAGQVLRGVRRVSGLSRVTDVVEQRDGGAGPLDPPLKLPGRTHFGPVILELGPPRNRRFETWAQAAAGLAPPSPRLATRRPSSPRHRNPVPFRTLTLPFRRDLRRHIVPVHSANGAFINRSTVDIRW